MDYEAILFEISNGDHDAHLFCRALWNFCHSQDDLIDQDKPIAEDVVVFNSLRLIHAVGDGAFYQKHKAMLWPVILVSIQAYMMSNEWARRQALLDRAVSQVLKSQYQDVFFMVAFLTGGYDHMMNMDRKYRMYSFDPQSGSKGVPEVADGQDSAGQGDPAVGPGEAVAPMQPGEAEQSKAGPDGDDSAGFHEKKCTAPPPAMQAPG